MAELYIQQFCSYMHALILCWIGYTVLPTEFLSLYTSFSLPEELDDSVDFKYSETSTF